MKKVIGLIIAVLVLVNGCDEREFVKKKQLNLKDKSPEFFYSMSYHRFIAHNEKVVNEMRENRVSARNHYFRALSYLESMRKYFDEKDVQKAADIQKIIDEYESVYKKWQDKLQHGYAREFTRIQRNIRKKFHPEKIIPNYTYAKEKEIQEERKKEAEKNSEEKK